MHVMDHRIEQYRSEGAPFPGDRRPGGRRAPGQKPRLEASA